MLKYKLLKEGINYNLLKMTFLSLLKQVTNYKLLKRVFLLLLKFDKNNFAFLFIKDT